MKNLKYPKKHGLKVVVEYAKKATSKTNFSYVGDESLNFMFIHKGFDEWYKKYKKREVTRNSVYDLYDPNDWRGYAYHIDAAQAWQIVKEYTKDIKHVLATVTREELPKQI